MGSSDSKTSASKFTPGDGITLYDSAPSPCARRVRMTLLEKATKYNTIDIDLLNGEQKSEEYIKYNANGKVPSLVIKNVDGLPDCCLNESNVITEYLDKVLPGDCLYPDDPWERAKVKMWQDWELAITDDFVPYMYQNVFGYILRAKHSSRAALVAEQKKSGMYSTFTGDKFLKCYDGTYRSLLELENHAIACYQHLVPLERELAGGASYLVANKFTQADLSVFPRVYMYNSVGLPIKEECFPHIFRYLNFLRNKKCFLESETREAWLIRLGMEYFGPVVNTIGNWRSGLSMSKFDGSSVCGRALNRFMDVARLQPLSDIGPNDIVVFDYDLSSISWQVKLTLHEKGLPYKTEACDDLELIGRPSGSGGLFRLQHGQRLIEGSRVMLDYINSISGNMNIYPLDPLLKAQSQCWQAWEQNMYLLEIYPLVEDTIYSPMLHRRYDKDNVQELLKLKEDPKHSSHYPSMIKCFLKRVDKGSDLWEALSEEDQSYAVSEDENQAHLELCKQAIQAKLQHMDDILQGQQYLVGQDVSIADICVFTRLLLLPFLGIEMDPYANITAWTNLLIKRLPFQHIAELTRDKLEGL